MHLSEGHNTDCQVLNKNRQFIIEYNMFGIYSIHRENITE